MKFTISILVFCLTLVYSNLGYSQFANERVQPPVLKAPEKGSVAGDIQASIVSSADITQGNLSFPLPLQFPSDRGQLLYSITPSYHPGAGLSPWGMGFNSHLMIRLWKEDRDINFVDDDLLSPWGVLKKGSDGWWYPVGLGTRVRVSWSSANQMEAYLDNGTTLVFGKTLVLEGSRGIFAWYLTEASNLLGERSVYEYAPGPTPISYPQLHLISYGGKTSFPQYQIGFAYERILKPSFDYRSGKKLVLDQRVKKLSVLSKNRSNGEFQKLYHYDLNYSVDAMSPRFYLSQIQRTFASEIQEPAMDFDYELPEEAFQKTEWKELPQYNDVIKKYGRYFYTPKMSSTGDVEQNGLTSIEYTLTYELIQAEEGQVTYEGLKTAAPPSINPCRRYPSRPGEVPPARQLVRFFGPDDSLNVFWSRYVGTPNETKMMLCSREGEKLAEGSLPADWEVGSLSKLADLNHSGKPDLVRVIRGKMIHVAENISTPESGIRFEVRKTIPINDMGGDPLAVWVIDLNGDGIPDIVARFRNALFVWYGKGNFEFETKGELIGLWDEQSKSRIAFNENTQFTFADINHDGLPELIVTNHQAVQFYLNQVSNPDPYKRMTTLTFEAPKDGYNSPTFPSFLDLAGTGNPQIVLTANAHIYAAELSSPNTGLLRGVNDGKGTSLSFNYKRMKPEPGIASRSSILNDVTLKSTGAGTLRTRFDFSSAKMHPKSRTLMGFEKVESTLKSDQNEPIETKKFQYFYDEFTKGLLLSSSTQDVRTPEIEQFQKIEYQDLSWAGSKVYQKKTEETGFQSPSGQVASQSKSYEYDEFFCPKWVTEKSTHGVLKTTRGRFDSKELSPFLHCLAQDISWQGLHSRREFDFIQNLSMARNEVGQPLKMISGSRVPRLLQEMTYDSDFRLTSVFSPKEGKKEFRWEDRLLKEIEDGSGQKVSVSSRHPLRDQIETLSTDHGSGQIFSEHFRYDEWNRMVSKWDNVSVGNDASPLAKFFYQFATNASVARVLSETRVDQTASNGDNAGSHWRKQIEFFTSMGETVGEATQTGADQQSWLLSKITQRDPSLKQSTVFQTRTTDLGRDNGLIQNELSIEALIAGAPSVSHEIASHLGTPLEQGATIQSGVVNTKAFTTQIVDGLRVESQLENKATEQKKWLASDGKILRWINEGDETTLYSYDVLGRLREIELPGRQQHQISYDEHGDLTRIARSEVGSVLYTHGEATGLLSKTEFFDKNQKKINEDEFNYDALGRVLLKKQASFVDSTKNKEIVYSYFYDGKGPGPSVIPGQLGFLTAVQGPSYTKLFKFQKDGKPDATELQIQGWKTLKTTDHYRSDGFLDQKKIEITAAASANPGVELQYRFETDQLGRAESTYLNQAKLFALKYNATSQIRKVTLTASKAKFSYDELTHSLKGYGQQLNGSQLIAQWELNPRGFILSESLLLGDSKSMKRGYTFTPQGYLLTDSDEQTERDYQYDASGMLTKMAEKGKSLSMEWKDDEILITRIPEPTQVYRKDAFGRIAFIPGNKKLTYGPTGRVELIEKDGAALAGYLYDEEGVRLIKTKAGRIHEVYWNDAVLNDEGLFQPLKVNGTLLGVLKNAELQPLHTDLRGSVLLDKQGAPDWPSPYGERKGERAPHSSTADYAQQGYDPDLGTYRMVHRDYSPETKQFHTADPLFLLKPEECVRSPSECNLYSYARGNPVSFVDPSGLNSDPNKALGSNQIVIDGFISQKEVGGGPNAFTFKGDNRGLGEHSTPDQSRLTIWIDPQNKTSMQHVSDSHRADGTAYSPSANNSINVQFGQGIITVDINAKNSAVPSLAGPMTPPITNQFTFIQNESGGWNSTMSGVKFPSWEVNQWHGNLSMPMMQSAEAPGPIWGPANLFKFMGERIINF